MQMNPEVENWFATKKPPAEAALRRVREVILAADPRMTEHVKYGTVQFAFGGDMAGFVQTDKKTVSLMFMRGGRIKGDFPHIEGTGRAVRFMRFADAAQVDARASELTAVVRAWCAAMAPKRRA
jgi:hypothetical protein